VKKRIFVSFFGFLLVLLTWERSHGQQVFITVKDQKSGEPVAFAHVCFEALGGGEKKYCLTSIEGKAPNDIKKRSIVAISYMGYETWSDTIDPGKPVSVVLKPKILNMDEVVVTAQYTPERADRSIYRIDVINSRQIELKAATNMADLLKDQVSMRVTQTGVLGTTLTIQGLSGENVKFLMDGVPVIGRMNGNIDLNQLNLYNVDHVEIIEGPMSVIYGSNALAGVVNIISKENKYSTLNATADMYTESVGVFNFNAAVSMNLKKHIFSLDGGRNFFGGYNPDAASYSVDAQNTFKPRRQYFFDGYYIFTPNDRLRIKAGGEYFNELIQDKGPLLPTYFETGFESWFQTVRYVGRVDFSYNFARNYYLTGLGSYSGYNRVKTTYFIDYTTLEKVRSENPDDQDTTDIGSWTGRLVVARNKPGSRLGFQSGLDLSSESGDGKRILGNHQEIGDYAAFFSLRYDPWKVLSIQPGVRFIYNTKYHAPVVYALSVKWNILPELSLRGSYSRGFRSPSIKELYLYFVDINHNVLGNPDLKAEESNNFNLAFNFAKEKRKTAYSAELSGFYNVIDNGITLAQGAGTVYTYINVDMFKTYGGQFNAGFDLYPSLKLTAGVAETGRKNYVNSSESTPEAWFYTTDVTATASYRFVKPELTFSLIYKYTGKVPQFFVRDGVLVEGYISPYKMMDFTAMKGFWQNRIRLSAGVKNIFNVKTVTAVGDAAGGAHGGDGGNLDVGWGRTLFLKLTLNFNKLK
jgi:outer membrane receptor for ferrienterochelin and colicins